MKRALLQALKFSLAALLILYAGDWGLYQIRMERQTGLGSVQVDQFLATRLKGEKQEFDYLGTVAQVCARSLFPHASNLPCWWLEGHRTQWEK
jgi:hypothetical protein